MSLLYATASAPGGAHVNPGQPGKQNNQDVILAREHDGCVIAAVCDGCGSQSYSEVGARIGANSILRAITAEIDRTRGPAIDWDRVMKTLMQDLAQAARLLSGSASGADFERAVIEHLLFTAVAIVGNENECFVAACGDGVVVTDDDVTIIEPPIPNTPPYAAYLLLPDSPYHSDPELRHWLRFLPIGKGLRPSAMQRGLIVGSDGLVDLVDDLDELYHPLLMQPKILQRWINKTTAESIDGGRFVAGRCHDDVSLIILRREATQEKLLAERAPLVTLKNKITELEVEKADLQRCNDGLKRDIEELRNRPILGGLGRFFESTPHPSPYRRQYETPPTNVPRYGPTPVVPVESATLVPERSETPTTIQKGGANVRKPPR